MKQDYFDRVYDKTYRALLRYAVVHLSDPTDAEDALQTVYLDFYRRIEQFGHLDILSPQAFLMQMLKREIIKHYAARESRKAHLVEEYDETGVAGSVTFEDAALDRAMADQVLAAAKSLPAETYRIFLLYYGFELSVAEIAKELQLSRETVKTRLYRACSKVRADLHVDEETPVPKPNIRRKSL